MKRHFRPSGPYAIALLALFVALGGTAFAVSKNSVKSKHIVNGEVKSADLKNDGIKGKDVKADTLTGDEIDESSLVLGAGGDPCADGNVLAWAQLDGATIGGSFEAVEHFYHCDGGTVEVKRNSAGNYDLRVSGLSFDSTIQGIVAQVTPVGGSGGSLAGYGTTVSDNLRVNTYNNAGTDTDKVASVTIYSAGDPVP